MRAEAITSASSAFDAQFAIRRCRRSRQMENLRWLTSEKVLAELREPRPRLAEGEWRRERATSLCCSSERTKGVCVGSGIADVPLLVRSRSTKPWRPRRLGAAAPAALRKRAAGVAGGKWRLAMAVWGRVGTLRHRAGVTAVKYIFDKQML